MEPQLPPEGTVYQVISTLSDISPLKKAEQALRESEAKFHLLFADNPLPMWVYDRETLAFLEVNEAAVAFYGYAREAFLQMRITDIRPEEDAARLLSYLSLNRTSLQYSGDWPHRL